MDDPVSRKQRLLGWLDVLDQIDGALRRSLAECVPPPEPAAGAEPSEPTPLDRLDDRLAAWQGQLDRANDEAAAAERLAGADETALADAVARLGRLRELLARWRGEAV